MTLHPFLCLFSFLCLFVCATVASVERTGTSRLPSGTLAAGVQGKPFAPHPQALGGCLLPLCPYVPCSRMAGEALSTEAELLPRMQVGT